MYLDTYFDMTSVTPLTFGAVSNLFECGHNKYKDGKKGGKRVSEVLNKKIWAPIRAEGCQKWTETLMYLKMVNLQLLFETVLKSS